MSIGSSTHDHLFSSALARPVVSDCPNRRLWRQHWFWWCHALGSWAALAGSVSCMGTGWFGPTQNSPGSPVPQGLARARVGHRESGRSSSVATPGLSPTRCFSSKPFCRAWTDRDAALGDETQGWIDLLCCFREVQPMGARRWSLVEFLEGVDRRDLLTSSNLLVVSGGPAAAIYPCGSCPRLLRLPLVTAKTSRELCLLKAARLEQGGLERHHLEPTSWSTCSKCQWAS